MKRLQFERVGAPDFQTRMRLTYRYPGRDYRLTDVFRHKLEKLLA